VDGGQGDALASSVVSVHSTIFHLLPEGMRVRHYLVDHTHSNAYDAFAEMGRPPEPRDPSGRSAPRERALLLRDYSFCQGWGLVRNVPQNTYSVGLLVLSPQPDTVP